MMRCLILAIAILSYSFSTYAQSHTNDRILTTNEVDILSNAIKKSSFGCFKIADSCSKNGDSINASLYFKQVNPYILLYEGLTPLTIDSYLRTNFKLTATTRKWYISEFKKVYNSPKSLCYKTLERMAIEDQAVRANQNNADSATFKQKDEEMRLADSIHFAYLYNYTQQHGWPSLKNGSMYASIIAIHDHTNHRYYVPLLKAAILKGDINMSALSLIHYWIENNSSVLSIELTLKSYDNIAFPVNEMLDNIFPQNYPEIETAVKSKKNVHLFLVYKSKENKLFKEYSRVMQYHYFYRDDVLSKLFKRLGEYIHTSGLNGYNNGFWNMHWQPGDNNDKPELTLYVLYGDKKQVSLPAFDKLLSNEKVITTEIHFDVNKYTIKQESSSYLADLTQWLAQNPGISIEIDGHTDSDGEYGNNMKLSLARANEIKKQLVSSGINPSRLTTKGYGSTRPLSTGNTESDKAMNRRVEFIKIK
ncbi:MAG: OmpA family protein [Bacteroidetes bacterium]|nr:OmpA family protein [Bacteroidota bacterium]